MKTTTQLLVIFMLFIGNIYGQTSPIEILIENGVQFHDKGDYKAAIDQYKMALKLDKKSSLANYEIASSYFSLKEYEKAIEHANVIIANKKQYVDNAYILKGSALDLSGKPQDAIKTYEKGIKAYPNNCLLQYNLGYTYYNMNDYKKAETALQNALKINPAHSSSHLLLGYTMSNQNSRVKTILALYNFLLLEPTGNRAKNAYELLDEELKKGVTKKDEKSINITLSNNKESDDFRAAELMLSLLEASKNIEKNQNKTAGELFSENANSFFSLLGGLKKNNKGFWWNFYVDFFYSMTNSKHVEAFGYFISQTKNDKETTDWLTNNKVKVDALLLWLSTYDRKF